MMRMEILDRKKTPLMKREEVLFSVEHEGKATPARRDLLKEVAGKLKSKEDLLIIDSIFSATGKSKSEVVVLVYNKKDDIPKGKLEKMKARMEKKKEEAKEEEKSGREEKPEEKTEEPEKEEKSKEEEKVEEKKGG